MAQTIVPTQEKKYTYNEFFRKNRANLVRMVTQMGFQSSDAQDIVHDAISEFFGNGELPPEENLTRETIEEVVKPKLLGYIASAANHYTNQLQDYPLLGEHEALTPEEALPMSNSIFYLLLEYIEGIPAQRATRIPVSLLVDPWKEIYKREELEELYERLQNGIKQKGLSIRVEREIPHDLHHTRRDEIRDSRFRARIIRNRRQENFGDPYTSLKGYARDYWDLGIRLASRLASYARAKGLLPEEAEGLVERIANKPEVRIEFNASYVEFVRR